MTAELVESYTELRLSPQGVSFLTDCIILQRHVELAGYLRRFMVVAKMRGCRHSTQLMFYEIDERGVVMGEPLTEYQGALIGDPRRISDGDHTR